MSRRQGGARFSTSLIGWVFLDSHRQDGVTIRWQRGDPVAYVLDGQRIGDHGTADVLATIAVPPTGWTDLAEIRALSQRWGQSIRPTVPGPRSTGRRA